MPLLGTQALFVEGVDVSFSRLDDYHSSVLSLRFYGKHDTKFDLNLHIEDKHLIQFLKDLRDSIDSIIKEIQDVEVLE